jgi:hypothetical protein
VARVKVVAKADHAVVPAGEAVRAEAAVVDPVGAGPAVAREEVLRAEARVLAVGAEVPARVARAVGFADGPTEAQEVAAARRLRLLSVEVARPRSRVCRRSMRPT